MNIYDITVLDQQEQPVSLSTFQGKVLLIVNTATKCGFTPQYDGLQKLYDKYSEQGFEVLDFPCNQFKNQAPGSSEEINEFCSLNYQTTFKRFAKIDVNGPNAAPLFTFLKQQKKKLLGDDIKWNFEKFLIDREGNVVKRYESLTAPDKIANDIEALL
ncbi:MAG: glutathione peroxidase [Erysipelotrichaceae bacterium]|nr:glutathione peroxidase [Erysipelotrichaceae bacterium]